ncbi:MAG: 2-amino-4-hydroxy-6-hydroxymethyldihydropteridine diphosphokinase [Proteobacteria bacterium]|nr:2-amino-4-hydroxy-6-hydroxymethyldihydropteridine diphosphokinase [Pseudomonadota bacterium]
MTLPRASAAGGTPVRVYVSAGSNVAPIESLNRALDSVRAAFSDVVISQAYANAAIGFVGPDFINLAFSFTTDRSLADVLAVLHGIEEDCGRGRTDPKWAPRRMDLDVLLFGDLVGEFPGAKLPRPDFVKRAFMLGPLAEIAPDAVHPTLGESIGWLWSQFDQASHRLRHVQLDSSAG